VKTQDAPGGTSEQRQHAEQRGLAGAVRADHQQYLARENLEQRHVENDLALVPDLDVLDRQDRRAVAQTAPST
jgi:hypothetical protein